ncbi:MAG: hypothetical protein QM541_17205 [Flavobacterium sp.]|nr:hypothetical protein [Flavobacterium sp.]
MRVVDNNFNQAALTGVSKSTQGFLVFTTQDSYDAVLAIIKDFSEEQLNGWEDALAFTSAYTAYADPTAFNVNPQDNKNQNFEDPLLSRILDVNGLVQIEGFVFKTAYDNHYVLEMNQSHLATHYNNFKAGTFDATVMNKFDGSYDDELDLFAELRNGLVGNTPTAGTTTPFSTKKIKDKSSDEILTDQAGTQWKAECKAVYQNLPFYCRLFGEMKYTKKGGSIWWAAKTDIKLFSATSTCEYTPNRRSKVVKSVSDYRNDNKLNYNAYSGSRKLNTFILSLDFNYYSVQPGWRIVHTGINK